MPVARQHLEMCPEGHGAREGGPVADREDGAGDSRDDAVEVFELTKEAEDAADANEAQHLDGRPVHAAGHNAQRAHAHHHDERVEAVTEARPKRCEIVEVREDIEACVGRGGAAIQGARGVQPFHSQIAGRVAPARA